MHADAETWDLNVYWERCGVGAGALTGIVHFGAGGLCSSCSAC